MGVHIRKQKKAAAGGLFLFAPLHVLTHGRGFGFQVALFALIPAGQRYKPLSVSFPVITLSSDNICQGELSKENRPLFESGLFFCCAIAVGYGS